MLMWYLHQVVPLIDTDSLGDTFFFFLTGFIFFFLIPEQEVPEQEVSSL